MAKYKLFFRTSVEKDLKPLPKRDLVKILTCIESLATNPQPSDYEKLTGLQRYRVRQGNYRILYSIQDKELTVWVVKIGHQKDVYRNLLKE
jgi:mRNA interferase RelE/StbE